MGFDNECINLERVETLRAANFDDEATLGRKEKSEMGKYWPQGWPEAEGRKLDDRIAHATTEAKIARRRAAHAREGYVLASPDESSDHEFMARNQHLVAEAHRRGRAKVSTESLRGPVWAH